MENPHHRNTDGYSVTSHPKMGYRYLSPIPSQADLAALYQDDYYDDHYPEWIEKSLREKDYWLMVYSDRYDVLEAHGSAESRRILDIGSFLGFFLEVGQSRGWECLGIEPSTIARKIALESEIETRDGLFEAYSPEDIGTFDVVNLSLTLEHIADPVATLERIYTFLNPGGIVCIEVPNDFNPLQEAAQKTLGLHEYWVAPPHHINYFNFENLPTLLSETGFDTLHKMGTFPMELFLLMGDHYIGQDDVGRACHQKRMDLELRLRDAGLNDFKMKLYTFLAEQNMGREAIVFGRKR